MKNLIVDQIATETGFFGHIQLDNPKSFNALNIDMIQGILETLKGWRSNDKLLGVIIDANHPKAFCAGGDIRSLYRAMESDQLDSLTAAKDFFATEYIMDYELHTYPRPVVVWGHGIVMGGGMGIFQGADFRVVTPASKLAMPEITIGLFPDVGASYFLNKLDKGIGLFLGLTGVQLNATDALDIGLADLCISDDKKSKFIDSLKSSFWKKDSLEEDLASLLRSLSDTSALPEGQFRKRWEGLSKIFQQNNFQSLVEDFLAMSTQDPWVEKAQANLGKGCPMTARIVWDQLSRAQGMSLEDVFTMELTLAARCCEKGDFQEGVRALLIDKDFTPAWRHTSIKDVTLDEVEEMFISPWEADIFQELAVLPA